MIGVSSGVGVGVGVGVKIRIKIASVCLGADCFAFGELLLKSTKSNQKCLLLVWPSFVGFLPSGPAPWPRRHPPSMAGGGSRGIHAARPTAQDLRSACTQVAFGGVWAFCAGNQEQIKSRSKADQEQIKGFPAEAGPTGCVGCVIAPVPSVWAHPLHDRAHALRGYASRDAPRPFSAIPVLLTARGVFMGPASAGKRPAWAPLLTGRDQVWSRPNTNGR